MTESGFNDSRATSSGGAISTRYSTVNTSKSQLTTMQDLMVE